VRNADLFVGTSARSRVAAQITSKVTLEELFQQQADPRLQTKGLEVKIDFKQLKGDYVRARQGDGGNIGFLGRMGALAMAASTGPESERRNVIASQLPVQTWPEPRLLAVAVDAESGERRVFDRTAGVPLLDAVAASCAVPGMSPTITIEGRHYMDGAVYSADNADLAGGFDRVLILTLTPGVPQTRVLSLDAAVEMLRSNGSQVLVVHPDEATEAAFSAVGGNIPDPSVREGAARAGREQGRRIAALDVASLWQ
jgi:NTE family protein